MNIFNIQSLISKKRVAKVSEVDATKTYIQVGVYQDGNRPIGSGNANTYKECAMPISELVDSAYNQVQDEGLDLPKRQTINFVGTGVTASDVGGVTQVSIPGTGFVAAAGSFYDTTLKQTGAAGSVLTMSLNNSDPWNTGVTIVSGTQITVANPGVYNLAFSAQMVKETGNSATHIHIWLAQNGIPVPYSASQISFPANSVYIVPAWNFFFKTTVPNEYVELKWQISSNQNNAVVIETQAPVGSIPGIPGLIVTINQVN